MKFTHLGRAAVVAAAGALLLTSCASNEGGAPASSDSEGSSLSGTLNGAGASSMGSAQEAWIAAFQEANPDVTVNYEPSGSGAGREAFISGAVGFAGSDSYLKDEELAGSFAMCATDASAVDLPVYISPIAVIYNVEGVEDLKLDAATLAGIFKGEITKWNDPAIMALNEGVSLPDATITAVHRSDDSGTTKNFADYLNANAPEVWDAPAADAFPYQTGEAAQGTSGVVDAVTNGTNTIGYADASRAGNLGVAQIKVGDQFVAYTPEAAAHVVTTSPLVEGREANDLAIKIDRTTTEEGAYPLVLVSYAIVCTEYADPEVGSLVKAYVSYIASEEGQAMAAEQAGAAPLSEEIRTQVADVLETVK